MWQIHRTANAARVGNGSAGSESQALRQVLCPKNVTFFGRMWVVGRAVRRRAVAPDLPWRLERGSIPWRPTKFAGVMATQTYST